MILSSAPTSIKLEAVLAGAIATSQPEYHVDYIEYNNEGLPTIPQDPSRGALNSTTDVTILAAPVNNPRREILRISLYNKDTASVTFIVKTDDGTTERILIRKTIGTLDSLCWEKTLGWYTTATGSGIFTTLTVTGASTLTGAVSMGSTLSVTGTITAAAANFSGLVGVSAVSGIQWGTGGGNAYAYHSTNLRIGTQAANGNVLIQPEGSTVGTYSSTGLAITGTLSATGNATLVNLRVSGSQIDEVATNSAADLSVNFVGYQGGTTQFRNFVVYDGKSAAVITAIGATKAVTLGGQITTSAPTGGAGAWELGIANSVSPTSPNRTLTVEIGGTAYYIHAKTTND